MMAQGRQGRRMSQAEVVLKQAIESNDLAQIRFALRAGQSWRINEQDDKGMTALQRSCLHGRLDIVRLLLDNGADLEITDERGWTALHFGASAGHVDVVTFLLNSCANVSPLSRDDKLPIDVAKGEGMVFLLASAILRAGKQGLLRRYLPAERDAGSSTSLQSLESDKSSHRLSAPVAPPGSGVSTPLNGSSSLSTLSQGIFRASQQFFTERFSSYLNDKCNNNAASVDRGLVGKSACVERDSRFRRDLGKMTRINMSYPVCAEPAERGSHLSSKKRRLNSFNSSFSPEVLERFAVSETNLNRIFDEFLHDNEQKGSDINRFPIVSDLTQNLADSDVWIKLT